MGQYIVSQNVHDIFTNGSETCVARKVGGREKEEREGFTYMSTYRCQVTLTTRANMSSTRVLIVFSKGVRKGCYFWEGGRV